MDANRFDQLATSLGQRRSRRKTLAGAFGAGALALAATSRSTSAQDATPAADPGAPGGVHVMFVQTLGAGSIDAATDGVESLLLVADHLAGQTVYFSDRPDRIVGMVPTEQFLAGGPQNEGIGFTPADPPNAALVLPGDQVLVVELIDPQYDPATGQVRYQLRVLEDLVQVDLQLESPISREQAVGEFTAASLFIDDCPDGHVDCYDGDGNYVGSIPGSGNMGFCWDSNDLCCLPCEGPIGGGGTWDAGCDHAYPSACSGGCSHTYNAAFSCAND